MKKEQNPIDKYPKPPFEKQDQAVPGVTSKMDPLPDHGEIAPVYVFLASEAASYISDATIPATGGRVTI